jgi:hypothetical protein
MVGRFRNSGFHDLANATVQVKNHGRRAQLIRGLPGRSATARPYPIERDRLDRPETMWARPIQAHPATHLCSLL